MVKIMFEDKVALNENPSIADINKVNASDMNEIKTVVNNNADTLDNIVSNTPGTAQDKAYSQEYINTQLNIENFINQITLSGVSNVDSTCLKMNNMIFIILFLKLTSSTTITTTPITIATLPSGYRPSRVIRLLCQVENTTNMIKGEINADGTITISTHTGTVTTSTYLRFSAGFYEL